MADEFETCSRLVRELRASLRLKQEAFASRLGVSQAYISRIEGGGLEPSAAFWDQLLRLKREAERLDPFLRLESSVAISDGLESLVYLEDGDVRLRKFSRGFRQLGGSFNEVGDGDVLEGRVGEDADFHFDLLKHHNAFSGDVLEVRNVWLSESGDGVRFMSAASVPVRSGDGLWHIKSTHVEISACEFERRKKYEIVRG